MTGNDVGRAFTNLRICYYQRVNHLRACLTLEVFLARSIAVLMFLLLDRGRAFSNEVAGLLLSRYYPFLAFGYWELPFPFLYFWDGVYRRTHDVEIR